MASLNHEGDLDIKGALTVNGFPVGGSIAVQAEAPVAPEVDDLWYDTDEEGGGSVGGTYVTQAEFLEQGPSGRELDAAESSVAQSGIAGTATDLTGLIITFEVGDRPVYVELDLPWVTASATAGGSAIIAQGGGTIMRYGGFFRTGAQTAGVRVVERISTPGTYTRKAQLQRSSGTGTFSNNFDLPSIVSTLVAVER